jgi:hypothetical protein
MQVYTFPASSESDLDDDLEEQVQCVSLDFRDAVDQYTLIP